MFDVVVVGGGLFGTIITDALRWQGYKVSLIDDWRTDRGSDPAACLMKPGWFSSLGKAVYNPSLEMLNELYDLKEVKFKTQIGKKVEVMWVPPKQILQRKKVSILGTVDDIYSDGNGGWRFHVLDLGQDVDYEEAAKIVIVAAGIWTHKLVPSVQQKGQAGMAFLWKGIEIEEPFIKVWAPYKQIVAFNRGDGLWVGDGNAILWKNWQARHAQEGHKRCVGAVKIKDSSPDSLFGIRPYHEMKPCLLEEVKPNLWVASGGAKNGTLAAGWCASQLLKRIDL